MDQIIGSALVVEDNPLLISILDEMIQDLGFSVTTARDLVEAREAFGGCPFDLVLTDLSLRGDQRAGIELAREVCDHSDTPVVVVSGYPRPQELESRIVFLRKPFTADQLQLVIASLTAH